MLMMGEKTVSFAVLGTGQVYMDEHVAGWEPTVAKEGVDEWNRAIDFQNFRSSWGIEVFIYSKRTQPSCT